MSSTLAVFRREFVARRDLVWLAHRTGLKGDLTLVENLGFERALRAHSSRDPEEVYERLGIARLKKLILRSLSAGQQRRVALARWLAARGRPERGRRGRRRAARVPRRAAGRGRLRRAPR